MEPDEKDLQLKFDGPPITKIGGAPADAVVNALNALQRMVHLIGMRHEGRAFKHRAKPSTRVRQEYAIICKAAKSGSHVQPFDVASYAGAFTPASILARQNLLDMLGAFNSGDIEAVQRAIPNPRERWFMAEAASGLVPSAESGIQVTIRKGAHGPFNFKADQARTLIERFRSGLPPDEQTRRITGRIVGVDFEKYIVAFRPVGNKMFRFAYPRSIEGMLQSNRRRRVAVVGVPDRVPGGDVSGFARIDTISELEHIIKDIETVPAGNKNLQSSSPIRVNATYDFEDKVFIYQDARLGIDSYSEDYNSLRECIVEEIGFMWDNYAKADDVDLDDEAIVVKNALLANFREVDDASE